MTVHDENFRDPSGLLPILLGLVVFVSMTCLPATIRMVQLFS
ncbi:MULTISPECIES: hypothetical protein [Halomonadaceae]|nr:MULTISPECIES: hypothetical protein [Halomonas]